MASTVRFLIGVVVAIVSMVYLFAFAIPNLQHAQEVQRQAQIEYDQAQAELDEAMANLNEAVDEVCSSPTVTGCY